MLAALARAPALAGLRAASRGVQLQGALARGSTRAFAASAEPAGLSRERIEQLWEEHIETEFTEKSARAAVETMVPHATVNHVPVLTGGVGTAALEQFYAHHFIPRMPEDVSLTPIDRNFGPQHVVDEFLFEFTHTVKMDWMLPGVEPTGRKVSVPFVVVVKFEGEKLSVERIYWDQATVLVQVGLLDPAGLPVTGAEQAVKQREVSQGVAGGVPSNGLVPKEA